MPDTERNEVRCEFCATLITVAPDWRVIECPNCHRPIVRMDSDPKYD